MLEIYKTENCNMVQQSVPREHCWVHVSTPTTDDINYLVNILGIDKSFILSAIDPEEASRIDIEDEQTLIVVDVPTISEEESSTEPFTTIPMAIILQDKKIITISLKSHGFLRDIATSKDKDMSTDLQTRFTLQLLFKIVKRYLTYLRQLDKMVTETELKLQKTLRNKEIMSLLGLEKTLVYFSTSLKSIELLLNRISRGRTVKMYEEDEDILDDVIIETRQAIEMCGIYKDTLSHTMDAYSSIISNNLNIVMRTLTSVTLVAAVPTVISGLYGMNIEHGMPFDNFWWAPLIITGTLSLILVLILTKKGMFK